MSERPVSHTLYRFFDQHRVLLYVGRTVAPSRRWREHEKTKEWFDEVATVTREVFPNAEAVDAAERLAIATEGPLHNIMLNGRRRPTPVRRPPQPEVPEGYPATLITRWIGIQPGSTEVEPELDCLGDETVCECPACHDRRLCRFENLRSEYGWHPDFEAEIDLVESRYYKGHDLRDWYYDLFDISMFARMRLIGESKSSPVPAYIEQIESGIASVECPFC